MVIVCPAEAAVARLTAGALGPLLPIAALDAALASDSRPRRCRKLPARFVLLFCVLMNLYADEALPHVASRPPHPARRIPSAPGEVVDSR